HWHPLLEFGGYVSAEDRVLRGPLIVHTSDVLFLVAVIPQRVGDLSARIGRRRQVLHQVPRGGTEQGGIYTVVYESAAQRDLPAAVAGRRCERREVAGEHLGVGHPGNIRGRLPPAPRRLIAPKEKEFVAHERTAERTAELIAIQSIVDSLAVR